MENSDGQTRFAELIGSAAFEISPTKYAERQLDSLPPKSRIEITTHRDLESTLDLASKLHSMGYDAVPHLPARLVRSRRELKDCLDRLTGTGIRRLFVVGGDMADSGVYSSALQVLDEMAGLGYVTPDRTSGKFSEIGVAAYPEGHRNIDDKSLMAALKAKSKYATYATTQMGFNPKRVVKFIRRVREEGVEMPFMVGVMGAIQKRNTLGMVASYNSGTTMNFVYRHPILLWHLMKGDYRPDNFLLGFRDHVGDESLGIGGFVYYTMNSIRRTVEDRDRFYRGLVEGRRK